MNGPDHQLSRDQGGCDCHPRSQEALADSEERFRRLINTVHAHFYLSEVSPDGVFVNRDISDNFQILTGYPSNQFAGLVLLEHDDPSGRSGPIQRDDQHDHKGISAETEYRIIRADGQVIWVSDNAQVTQGENGNLLVFATILEITERKETEDHIRFLATHDPLTSFPTESSLTKFSSTA